MAALPHLKSDCILPALMPYPVCQPSAPPMHIISMKTAKAELLARCADLGEPMALRPSMRTNEAVNSDMNDETDPMPAAGYCERVEVNFECMDSADAALTVEKIPAVGLRLVVLGTVLAPFSYRLICS